MTARQSHKDWWTSPRSESVKQKILLLGLTLLLYVPGTCSAQMNEMYKEFCTKYDMVSIEDPFEQDDWEPAVTLTEFGICQVRRA
jgi:hypothetical protein